MPRFAVFLVEEVIATGYLRPRKSLSAFLQPQPNQSSSNPTNKSADSDSIVLTESTSNPGLYYADITNPAPRYDLYIGGIKQGDFSGLAGFNMPSSKSIYYKKNVEINANAYMTPQTLTTGTAPIATPDGGQTWPKFSASNLPMIVILEPSELVGDTYLYRLTKIVKNSISVDANGKLTFQVSLDPNGPDLANYYCDILIIMP